MTRATMQTRIADELNQLAADGSTVVDDRVTGDQINNKINDIYREELCQFLMDKFPRDFLQQTAPTATYTATSTIDSVSTTTLNVDDSIFDNTMEGMEIENTDQDERIEIADYVSATRVTMESSVADWDAGDTIYVLGNEYTFGGDATDLREVRYVGIKYESTDSYFRTCKYRDLNDIRPIGNETFSTSSPIYYLTTRTVSDVLTSAIGFRPFPTSYAGEWVMEYIALPPELGATDEPRLKVAGTSQIIIDGVVAWGKRLKKESDWEKNQGLYEKKKNDLLMNYKPTTRAGSTKIRLGGYYESIKYKTL